MSKSTQVMPPPSPDRRTSSKKSRPDALSALAPGPIRDRLLTAIKSYHEARADHLAACEAGPETPLRELLVVLTGEALDATEFGLARLILAAGGLLGGQGNKALRRRCEPFGVSHGGTLYLVIQSDPDDASTEQQDWQVMRLFVMPADRLVTIGSERG